MTTSSQRGAGHQARQERGLRDKENPTDGMTQEEVEEWIYDSCLSPEKYAENILGLHLYTKQVEILDALRTYPRVAVAGCNSSGKTFSMSPYALWRLTMSDRIAIMEIAPTGAQSRWIFWRDMRGLYRGSEIAQALLGGAVMNTMNIEVSEYKYAQAVTPGDVMSLRGYHSNEMFFMLDEGNGIDADIFTAINGIAASGDITVSMLGNPTSNSGVFYDAFMEPELGWHTINISAFDSPNLMSLVVPDWFEEESEAPGEISQENRKKLAYLVYLRRQWLRKRDKLEPKNIPELQILLDDEQIHLTRRMFVADGEVEWARSEHPSWYGQVLGVFPDTSENQLFSKAWIAQADRQEEYEEQRGPMVWGCDPAGMGQNEWALVGVQIDADTLEHRVIINEGYQGENAFEQAVERMYPFMQNSLWINVDRMGPGERPAIELKRWAGQWGVPVMAFASQDKSTNPLVFKDLKAQMYYFLRDLLQTGNISGITDRRTKQQLLSIRYEFSQRGQTQMETKKNMKKRGVDSPDRADALVYACFNLQAMAPYTMTLG